MGGESAVVVSLRRSVDVSEFAAYLRVGEVVCGVVHRGELEVDRAQDRRVLQVAHDVARVKVAVRRDDAAT